MNSRKSHKMDRRKKRFRTFVEPWALAVLSNRIHTEEAKSFLEVHSGRTKPNSEKELLWMEYWDGKPPAVESLAEIYLERARNSQFSKGYEEVVDSYLLAKLCGSTQANDWLKEQKMTPLNINSVWKTDWSTRRDLNGGRVH